MGWWECYDGTVIGDELADIVSDRLGLLIEDLVTEYPTISRDQILSTLAFCSGWLGHFDKPSVQDKILVVMTVKQMRSWEVRHKSLPDMNKRVAPGTPLENVFNPFTGGVT